MTRRRKLGIALTVFFALLLLVVLAAFHMERQDAEHARFYNTGKTVNDFLKGYCGALETSFAARNAAALAGRYSGAYAAPGRGAWRWGEPTPENDVVLRHLERQGAADYGRDELTAELGAYLDGLSRVDQTICKIVLIEDVEFEHRVTLTVNWQGIEGTRSISSVHYISNVRGDTASELPAGTPIEGIQTVSTDPNIAYYDDPALQAAAEGEPTLVDPVLEYIALNSEPDPTTEPIVTTDPVIDPVVDPVDTVATSVNGKVLTDVTAK